MSNPPHTPPLASPDARDPGQSGQDPGTVALTREYRFEAAHMLPRVPDGHRCKRMHGHSYKVEVTVAGPVNDDSGWLIDFYDLDRAVVPHIEALDHRTLNDLPGLENPTCERLCDWLWRRLAPSLPPLAAITVWETTDARCSYYGPRPAKENSHGR